jgi:hypothetical protein
MAYGTELFIGFKGKEKIDEIATELNLKVGLDGEITPENIIWATNVLLKKAWRDAIDEIGLEFVRAADNPRFFIVNTPSGIREMVPWDLELYYDPDEMGEEPEHAIFGISLISRYFPTFLDWASEHGGSGDIITLDSQTLINIQIARKHIEKVLPSFAKAEVHIKELHY